MIQKKYKPKKKQNLENIELSLDNTNHNIIISIEEKKSKDIKENIDTTEPIEIVKKRGRKPKGGKLFIKSPENNISINQVSNIILHLKCSTKDLNEHKTQLKQIVKDPLLYNPEIPPNIMTYNVSSSITFSEYFKNDNNDINEENFIENDKIKLAYNDINDEKINNQQLCSSCCMELEIENIDRDDDPTVNLKDINGKLKKLKINLIKNFNIDKKSACFWCTYEYDNHPCYIPKYEMNGELFGYGSFCRPECAVAYLMKENIDDSTKFERYQLLNQIYGKVYNFEKNIKPAPNPFFLLDKFYGNLSIQEYRKLLKSEHMLLVIEKPMTRILPELHEDNDDFIMNIFGGKVNNLTSQSGVYKVKKQCDKQKGPSKSVIIKENFGF